MNDQDKIKLVIDESNKLCKYLNNDLLVRFAELHNIKPKYSKFSLKQEVVAKKSLFFDVKKKYALHIVNREGKDVDEYDVKGLVTRRSDYPNYTKQCISELMDLILKRESIDFELINNYVEEKNKEFLKLVIDRDKTIAKPVTYSKKKEDYKNNRVPYHVMGMELWNKLEYDSFAVGTKGYLYNILGVDINKAPNHVLDNINVMTEKNTTIVLPFEEDSLPDYYIVDTKAMFKFCWEDRVNEFLSPLISEVTPVF